MIQVVPGDKNRGAAVRFAWPSEITVTYHWGSFIVSIPTGEAIPDDPHEVLTILGMTDDLAFLAMKIAKRYPGEPQTFVL